nr:hypothetical protein [Tanacetum cinerariifolium]
MGSFIKWFCRQTGKSKLSKADLEGPIYKGHRVVPDVSKPLPLKGPPGHVTIQPQFFFNKDLEYLLSGNKERSAMFISKLKAANYPDFGLEELIPHSAPSDRRAVIFHMQILSVEHCYQKRVEDLQIGIESYQTKLNLTKPKWDAFDFLFKEDYTIISKPRTVIYRDRSDQKKMMRESKVHKFSDGTLTRILEKLNHMVKDFSCSSTIHI